MSRLLIAVIGVFCCQGTRQRVRYAKPCYNIDFRRLTAVPGFVSGSRRETVPGGFVSVKLFARGQAVGASRNRGADIITSLSRASVPGVPVVRCAISITRVLTFVNRFFKKNQKKFFMPHFTIFKKSLYAYIM